MPRICADVFLQTQITSGFPASALGCRAWASRDAEATALRCSGLGERGAFQTKKSVSRRKLKPVSHFQSVLHRCSVALRKL